MNKMTLNSFATPLAIIFAEIAKDYTSMEIFNMKNADVMMIVIDKANTIEGVMDKNLVPTFAVLITKMDNKQMSNMKRALQFYSKTIHVEAE